MITSYRSTGARLVYCASLLTDAQRERLERLAKAIRAHPAPPTAEGLEILRALETGELTPLVKALIAGEPGSSGIVITNAG